MRILISARELSIDVIPKINLLKTTAHNLEYIGVDFERVQILKSRAATMNCDVGIKQELSTLEFCVVVGDIFNSILLCKEERFSESNIVSLERFLRSRTEYFAKMRRAHITRKNDGRFNGETRSWQRTGIAFETFRNFSLTVSGFVAYAKSMIKISAQVMPRLYIPCLHSNQSTIESLFSLIRSMNFDRVDKFSRGYGTIDFRHAAKAVSSSKTYEAENLDEEIHDSNDVMEQLVHRSDTKRSDQLDMWISEGANITAPANDVEQFPTNYIPQTPTGQRALNAIKTNTLTQHFASVLIASQDFQKWMLLSVSTQHAEYFAKLPKLTASELVEFDNGCQQIQAVIFRAMEECLASAKNSVHSSFEFRLFNIQTDGILNGICQVNFPSSL